MPTPDLFARVAQAATDLRLPILVIGGHAVNAYGYARTTLDADFLICDEDLPPWRGVFESFGYRWEFQTSSFVKFAAPSSDPAAFPVDVMLVNRDTLNRMLVAARRLEFGSTQLEAPHPLNLIALKLHAMRNEERRRTGKDLQDIVELIAVCRLDPESPEFQAIVLRHADPSTQQLLRERLRQR